MARMTSRGERHSAPTGTPTVAGGGTSFMSERARAQQANLSPRPFAGPSADSSVGRERRPSTGSRPQPAARPSRATFGREVGRPVVAPEHSPAIAAGMATGMATPVLGAGFGSGSGQSPGVRPVTHSLVPAHMPEQKEIQQPSEIRRTATKAVSGTKSKLPHLEKLQRAFGRHDLNAVEAYTGSTPTHVSRAIRAEAFAMGDKIVFRNPTPSLHTVAHEAAHVIQQRAGVRPSGGVGHPGDRHERQADAVASEVLRGGSAEALLPPAALAAQGPARPGASLPVVQRLIYIGKEPNDPSDYRKVTTSSGFSRGVTRAERKFANNEREDIIDNNESSAPNKKKMVTTKLASDYDRTGMLTPAGAKVLAPEVDHIVRKTDGGSTADENARVITKDQNTSPLVNNDRPDASDNNETDTVIYQDYEIEAQGYGNDHSLSAGDVLTLDQVKSFSQYATGAPVASWAAFNGGVMRSIVNESPDATKNQVEIRQE